MKLILVFSPGRVGTAYLSQVFGGNSWGKRKIHIQDRWAIGHEFWNAGKDISYLRRHDPFSEKSIKYQIEKIENDINNIQTKYGVDNIFCTSNLIGRFYSYCLPHLDGVEYKIINLTRESASLCQSFIGRVRSYEKNRNVKNHAEHLFNTVLFSSTDFTFHKTSNWNSLSETNKFLWYFAECEKRWDKLKITLDSDSYLQTTYEHIINYTGLEEVSKFTGLKYFPELMKIRVNPGNKYENREGEITSG
jgi:hypothetical protein